MEDAKKVGLVQKYVVTRTDGKVDKDAEYFVLRLDRGGSDPIHRAACRAAVMKYADKIKDHLPLLSKDLINRYWLTDSRDHRLDGGSKSPITGFTRRQAQIRGLAKLHPPNPEEGFAGDPAFTLAERIQNFFFRKFRVYRRVSEGKVMKSQSVGFRLMSEDSPAPTVDPHMELMRNNPHWFGKERDGRVP